MRYLVGKVDPVPRDRDVDGAMVMSNTKDKIDRYFSSESEAVAAADRLASKEPGVAYAVFGIVHVAEALAPKLVHKKLNESGELVVKP